MSLKKESDDPTRYSWRPGIMIPTLTPARMTMPAPLPEFWNWRMLKETEMDCTVKFIAFANEEPPFFQTKNMGSWHYVKDALKRKERIRGCVNLEMIGHFYDEKGTQKFPPPLCFFYPDRGNYIAVVGNFKSRNLARKITKNFKGYSTFPIERMVIPGFVPGIDYSDQWAFWKHGLPAVMITDTAFFRNRHYHKKTETYEKLNYPSMAKVVEGLVPVIVDLAK